MAEFAGAYAASHAPLIARDWAILRPELRDFIAAAYEKLGARIRAARPDVIIEIAPDHWSNFFLDNLPSVCIGVGETHDGPPEPFLRDFPHRTMNGHPAFASHLLATALEHGFEPSLSHHMKLDHGFCIPLWRANIEPLPAIVPIVINSLEPPMPSIARCAAWGGLLRDAIASYPDDIRIAVLASGGLSHSIGESTMGAIDEPLDRATIAKFAAGDEAGLVSFLDRELRTAGNGSHEVRNWVVASGAAGGRGFELLEYAAVPEVYVGCAWAAWSGAA